MVYIYILALEKNKYYIGKTNNPSFRIEEHNTGSGSAWTQKYKPVSLLQLIPNCDDYDEDKYTKMYMDKYGIDNVRGGSYVTIKLNPSIKKQLEQCSWSTNNKCFLCGSDDHFVKDCKKHCARCRRNNHNASRCYAKTFENGYFIDGCGWCGRNHKMSNCYAKTDILGNALDSSSDSSDSTDSDEEQDKIIKQEIETAVKAVTNYFSNWF